MDDSKVPLFIERFSTTANRGELEKDADAVVKIVNSPNHTVVYIPVGPMGAPLTGTMPAADPRPPR